MSMTTETRADTDALGLGRGGGMSRQGKREAVLRLLWGEELELVSRLLGVSAARFRVGAMPFSPRVRRAWRAGRLTARRWRALG